MMRNNRGFTLIELMVVIAILGIIAAIAVPNCLQYVARTRLKAANREMASLFQYTRSQVWGGEESWWIRFDPAAGRYYLIDGSNTICREMDLNRHPGIYFGSNNPSPIDANHVPPPGDGVTYVGEKVKFNPDGTATAGTVYLRNENGDTMALGTASASGRIKVWRDFGQGWRP